MKEEYNLECKFNSRKSFYGKARTEKKEGKLILISYSTEVAFIEDNKAVVKGYYSMTTLRHIKEFLLQNGFKAENKKQILKDHGVKK